MKKTDLVAYLDEYLDTKAYVSLDSSKNGLQVDNELDEIGSIGYAVDCTEYLIDKAIEQGVTMIIVHHGLFWGYDTPLTGQHYKRIKKLMDHNIALYASHLPLDLHGEVGNNIGLLKGWARLFGIKEYELEKTGEFKGVPIGRGMKYRQPVSVATIHTPFCSTLGLKNALFNYGKHEYIRSVAFVSGHPGIPAVDQSISGGYDLLITGEFVHHEHIYCKEVGQTVLLGGHYETEKIGPKLLAHHIGKKFEIDTIYLDESR